MVILIKISFFLRFLRDLNPSILLLSWLDCCVLLWWLFFFILNFLLFLLLTFFFLLLAPLCFCLLFLFHLCCLLSWTFLTLLCFFMFFLMWFMIFFVRVLLLVIEFFRHIPNASPILYNFFVLPTKFYKKSSSQYFSVVTISNEVYGVDFHFKDNFKGSRIIIFNFDELELRECFLNILLSSIEITFNQVEGDMFDFIIKGLNLVNELISLGEIVLFLLLATHRFISN